MTARKTAAARKPAKRASVAAREAEAGDGFVTIEHVGVTLRIPVGGKMPYLAALAFKRGENDRGNELLLGEKQWAALMEKNPTVDEMNEIAAKVQEALGN
ncbi:adenylosuccinate synthase [Mycolicibacterium litorale]|uniref:adenylosuccinate synthase n=1 Tax=Mycolicibacterium litorale TaxID=758802 RepID=UPI003CEDED7F